MRKQIIQIIVLLFSIVLISGVVILANSDDSGMFLKINFDDNLIGKLNGESIEPVIAEDVTVDSDLGVLNLGKMPKLRYILGTEFPAEAGKITTRFKLTPDAVAMPVHRYIYKITTEPEHRTYLRIMRDGRLHCYWSTPIKEERFNITISTEDVDLTEWQKIVHEWKMKDDKLIIKMFWNGEIIGEETVSSPMKVSDETQIILGSRFFAGQYRSGTNEDQYHLFTEGEIDYVNIEKLD